MLTSILSIQPSLAVSSSSEVLMAYSFAAVIVGERGVGARDAITDVETPCKVLLPPQNH